MKKSIITLSLLGTIFTSVNAQLSNVKFEEYDLPNGLHVILHEDKSTPIVSVSIMYHVGSKNEDPERTGFAHFFEHLLFEGSENIKRQEFMKIVQNSGGVLNANTSHDRTYYFEILPSNQLELGLWLESERLLHAKIDSIGIETQRKVVKEEKKQSYDNRPYGYLWEQVFSNMYTVHPYRWTPIGSEQYIDMATEKEFMDFYKLFYVPNNAVLVLAGDINIPEAKKLVEKYFGDIPKGTQTIPRPNVQEPEQKKEKSATYRDPGIQLPLVAIAFHAPKIGTEDFYALNILTQILSGGSSSRLQKELIDNKELASQVGAMVYPLEDNGFVAALGVTNRGIGEKELERAMKNEIEKLKSGDITQEELQKALTQIESELVSLRSSISGIAEALAENYTYHRNTNLVNTVLDNYNKITIEDLKRVANKYFVKNNTFVLHYLPK